MHFVSRQGIHPIYLTRTHMLQAPCQKVTVGSLGPYVYLEGTPQQSEKFQKTKTGKMGKRNTQNENSVKLENGKFGNFEIWVLENWYE